MENSNELAWVVQVLWILIPVLVSIAIGRVYPKLKAKYEAETTASQRAVIEGVGRMVVLAVEGYMKSAPGQEKLAEAERKVNEILASKGLPTNVAEIRSVIEASVYEELNKDKKENIAGKSVSR